MEIELVPDPGSDDPASQAAVLALLEEGLATDVRPVGSTGAWRQAGLADAVNRSATPNRAAAAVPGGAGPRSRTTTPPVLLR